MDNTASIPIPQSGPLRTMFEEMPVDFRAFLRQGFSALSGVAKDRTDDMVRLALEAVGSPLRPEESLAADLGVREEDLAPLMAAAGVLTLVVGSRTEEPEEVITEFVRHEVIAPDSSKAATLFASALAEKRDKIKKLLEASRLGSEVLPTLVAFEIAVDLRFRFGKTGVTAQVPVAILHLDTDGEGQELWLQMTRPQLKAIEGRLGAVLKEFDVLDEWLSARGGSEG